ncbi:hypothetical protein D5R29_15355 [Escherichia coli]|nr:hypothetical protein [Escherichia coli]
MKLRSVTYALLIAGVATFSTSSLAAQSLRFGYECIDSLEVRKKTGRTLDYSGSDGIRFGGACKPVAQILVVNQ